jgi:fatty-acyl-CoA synthase
MPAFSTIRLWKGYHSADLFGFIVEAWRAGAMLVLCPPMLEDFDFIPSLPRGDLDLVGDGWTTEARARVEALGAGRRREIEYPSRPILGVFTSGTAGGDPRLVLYSKANVAASLGGILEVFDRDRIDAIFCYPQPFHTFGLVLGYVQAIATGRPLIAPLGRYSPDFHRAWREAARVHPGMLTLGTPTHFRDLLRASEENASAIPPTYSAIIGGAATPRELWFALRDRLRIQAPSIGYGCTEAAPGLTHLPPGVAPNVDGEIGSALRETRLEILPGIGLEFSGPQTCLAILQNGRVEFPPRVLLRDRLARLGGEGESVRYGFEGRYDLVFNRGGVKFSLEAIERFLRDTFPTTEFLGVAVPDRRLGEELGLLVKPSEPPREGFRKAISAALFGKYHAHFNPAHIVWTRDLPLNAAAKPDRREGSRRVSERPAEHPVHPR